MRASVVRPGGLGEPELRRWHEFQAAELELQNPFLSSGFARAVDAVSDRARVAVIEDGSAIVGFLAFELRAPGVATAIGSKLNTRQAFVHAPGLLWTWPWLLEATNLDVLELGDLVGIQSDGRRSLETGAAPVIDTASGWDAYLQRIKKSKNVKTTLYKDTLKTGDGEVATGYVSRPSGRTIAYQASHVPGAAVRSYVLNHPEIRSFVRESLKKVGTAREAPAEESDRQAAAHAETSS